LPSLNGKSFRVFLDKVHAKRRMNKKKRKGNNLKSLESEFSSKLLFILLRIIFILIGVLGILGSNE
jgi:hypothetical protein